MANILGNNFWDGVLGVVDLTFNNVSLGKTTDATEILYEEDIQDIIYQQDGTKPADKVRTGCSWTVNATFGEIDTSLVTTLITGATKSGGAGDSVKLGRELYQSMLVDEAKALLIKRIDSEGAATTDNDYRLKFYKAVPMLTSGFQFGADVQRNLQVSFYCFWDATEGAYGYSGEAGSLSLGT